MKSLPIPNVVSTIPLPMSTVVPANSLPTSTDIPTTCLPKSMEAAAASAILFKNLKAVIKTK